MGNVIECVANLGVDLWIPPTTPLFEGDEDHYAAAHARFEQDHRNLLAAAAALRERNGGDIPDTLVDWMLYDLNVTLSDTLRLQER